MDHCIIDLQGFKRSLNKFVFKEVAVIAAEADAQPTVFLFQAPFPWTALSQEYKSSNNWLQRNYHGLSWESGHIPYEALQQTLEAVLADSATIYIKGLEKKNWLAELLPNKFIYNVEGFDCPALSKLPRSRYYNCSNHCGLKNYRCAAENVQILKSWLLSITRDEVDT